MADNSYSIEMKPVSQYINGSQRWFTPQEARNYYGRFGRDGITIHWWGDGGKNTHDQTVAFFERRADGSVNYVASDAKITYMVSPDNVAFTSQSGNATTISIECQTLLGAEGYKKVGWLVDQLEGRYGKPLPLFPHNHWFATQCPGSLDLNRIRQEANNWKNGVYDKTTPPPVVEQPPKQIKLEITDIVNRKVRMNKDGVNLWDLHFGKYADAKPANPKEFPNGFPKGHEVEVSATAKHPLGSTYYLSEYSFSRGIGKGINIKDCEEIAPATEIKDPPKVTPPEVVTVPVVLPPSKDDEQDKRLSAIEAFIESIKKMFKGLGG